MRPTSIAITSTTTANAYQVACTSPPPRAEQPLERADGDQDGHEREKRGLGERGQVLGLAVPVLVRAVGRPRRDAERRRTSAAPRRGPCRSGSPRR